MMKDSPAQKMGNPVWFWIWVATGVTLGMQAIRVLLPGFVYYLRDAQGFSSLTLAPIALGIFALSILAIPAVAWMGLRGALLVSTTGLVVFRLAEQVSTSPSLDLYLASAAVIAYLVFLPLAFGLARRALPDGGAQFGLGMILGFALDATIHLGAGTLDLSWQVGFIPLLLVVLLGGVFTLALRALVPATGAAEEGGWTSLWPLSAIGVWTFLQLLLYQNVARMAALTDWSLPAAGFLVLIGNLVTLLIAGWMLSGRLQRLPASLVTGAGLLVTTLVGFGAGAGSALITGLGSLLAAVLMQTVFMSAGKADGRPGLFRTGLAFFLGAELFGILAFLYYATLDIALGFRAASVLPAAGLLLTACAVGAAIRPKAAPGQAAEWRPVWLASLSLVVPVVMALSWSKPAAPESKPAPADLRVMSYNLHQGFDIEGGMAIEALARVIAEQDPDVVALQEVSRGYLINGSLDMLAWLARRLQMGYFYGPTADPQWGNALLSRYPLQQADNQPLPPRSLKLLRGYIDVTIEIESGEVRILATHLHHMEAEGAVRETQVDAMLAAWGNSPRTLLLGDLNATPDSPEMRRLENLGWVDVTWLDGRDPNPTYSAGDPVRQIDYIWITPDIQSLSFAIPASTASDHLPVVADIRLIE